MIKLQIHKLWLWLIYSLPIIWLLGLGFWNLDIIYGNEEAQPIIVDGDIVKYSADAKEVTARGNVVVTYKDTRMTCDEILVNTQTKDGVATGNVRLEDMRGILEAEKLTYNFETKKGDTIKAKIRSSPYYYYGDKAKRVSEEQFVVRDGYFSSCNYDHPHFRMKSKRVEIFPGDKVVSRGNTFYWMNVPFFYLPRYSHSLKDPFMKVQFQVGKTSDWGVYLLSAWRHDLNDNVRLRLYLDWRERWGFADGFGINYDSEGIGSGDFKLYHTHERRADSAADQRVHQEFQRYFVRYRHMWDIDSNTKLTAQYYRIEDSRRGWHPVADMLRDYFYREYEKEAQPKSYVLVNRTLPYSNMSMLLQKRTNRWFGETEKLPEVAFNLPKLRIGEGPFYFENQTKFSNLNRKYPTPSELDDDVIRFDSYNESTLPTTLMFLEVSPYLGLRETYYSKDEDGEWISPRTAFYTGIDTSTKFYRIFNVRSNFLGLNINKLRHIVSPKVTYAYIHEPTISRSKLQQFDDIDSIDGDSRFKLELENKLQTKRAHKSVQLATFRISSDYIMYSKASNYSTGQDRFTDFLFDLELTPFAWLRMQADATYNHRQDYFSTVNLDNWFDFGNERSFGIGHRYQRKPEGSSPTSKEMTTQLVWRINPKWKFRFYGRYQFTKEGSYRDGLREQEYTIYRDLHCGTLEISFNKKKKIEAKTDASVWCVFNLKIFKESEFDYVQSYHSPKVLDEE